MRYKLKGSSIIGLWILAALAIYGIAVPALMTLRSDWAVMGGAILWIAYLVALLGYIFGFFRKRENEEKAKKEYEKEHASRSSGSRSGNQ